MKTQVLCTMITLACVVLLVFASCGGGAVSSGATPAGSSALGAKADSGAPAVGTGSSGNVAEPVLTEDEKPYANILQAYWTGMKTNFKGYTDDLNDPVYNTLCAAIVWEWNSTEQSGYVPNSDVYTLYDIDGDGTPELLLGYGNAYGVEIYDCWTISGGKPVRMMVKQLGGTDSAGIMVGKGYIADTRAVEGSLDMLIYNLDSGKLAKELALGDDSEYDKNGSLISTSVRQYYQAPLVTNKDGYDDPGTEQEISKAEYDQLFAKYGFDTAPAEIKWRDLRTGEAVDWPAFTSASASSTRASMDGINYDAKNVLDGDFSTAWCEGVPGPGIGEWIELHADTPQRINQVFLTNGYYKSNEAYTNNNSISVVTITGENGFSMQVPLKHDPTAYLQEIDFAKPIDTSWLRFTITDVYPGTADDNDTLISEIQVE